MVAVTQNGRGTAKNGRAKQAKPGSPKKDEASDSATGAAGIGDLGTIQSILLGEFSSAADTRFSALEARIHELESDLASAQIAHSDSVREHNQALGQVKADLTRTKKSTADLFEEQDAVLSGLRSSAVDRTTLAEALRGIADLLTDG